MRVARALGVLRREKTLVVAVLAPALLILAMGPLALLRPAVPATSPQVTPSVTIAQPKAVTSTPALHIPTVLPVGRNPTKTPPRTGGEDGRPRGGRGPR